MTFLSPDLTTAPGRGTAPSPVATLTPRGSAARTVGEEQAGDVSLRSTPLHEDNTGQGSS